MDEDEGDDGPDIIFVRMEAANQPRVAQQAQPAQRAEEPLVPPLERRPLAQQQLDGNQAVQAQLCLAELQAEVAQRRARRRELKARIDAAQAIIDARQAHHHQDELDDEMEAEYCFVPLPLRDNNHGNVFDPVPPSPQRQEPPRQEPPRQEPPSQEPPRQEPPRQEPPRQEPPSQEPPRQEPPRQEPPRQEPPRQGPPRQEPPRWEPPRQLPQLEPLPAQTTEEAEEVYESIRMMFNDVKKPWIVERAGNGAEVIANFIVNHEDFVPRNEAGTEQEQDDIKENDTEPLDPEEEEKRGITIEALKEYLTTLDSTKWQPIATAAELREYIKHQFSYVNIKSLSKIKSPDPRRVLAICMLIEMKAMNSVLAGEIGAAALYDNDDPVTQNARRLRPEAYKMPALFKQVKKDIDGKIRKQIQTKKFCCPVCFENFSPFGIMTCTGLPPDDNDRERFFSYPEAMSNFLETHFLCMACMKRHAEFIATNEPLTTSNGQGIRCIEPSCKNIILTVRIEGLLDKKEKRILSNRLAQSVLRDIEGIEQCPKCDYALFIEASYEEDKVFACHKCKYECCRRCQREWKRHCGLSCPEMEAAESETLKRRKREEKLSEAVMLTCPSCKLKWAKKSNSGECNKMTCQCGCKFCMVCLAGPIDYSHFCRHCEEGDCPADCGRSCHLYEPDDAVERKKRDVAMMALEEEEPEEVVDVVPGVAAVVVEVDFEAE